MINKFIGIGNLTKDPESKKLGEYFKCAFSIAINSTKDEVIFLDVESWGKTAENCQKFIKKGAQVYIEGKIKISKWEDKNGNKRQKYYISADLVRFLQKDKKPSEQNKPEPTVPEPSVAVKEIIDDEDMPFLMSDINYNGPINSLSFGNVSYNILKAIHKKGLSISFFPIGSSLDFSAFDKADENLKKWIQQSYDDRYKNLSKDAPSLRMWHLNGSEIKYGDNQFLYTFYECDQPTETEVNLCNYQQKTIFSSSYAKESFEAKQCNNVDYIPIGFDEDFHETGRQYLEDKINFGLIGKFEKRKHTARLLKLWAQKYGNNKNYQLTCCVSNPFLKKSNKTPYYSKL